MTNTNSEMSNQKNITRPEGGSLGPSPVPAINAERAAKAARRLIAKNWKLFRRLA